MALHLFPRVHFYSLGNLWLAAALICHHPFKLTPSLATSLHNSHSSWQSCLLHFFTISLPCSVCFSSASREIIYFDSLVTKVGRVCQENSYYALFSVHNWLMYYLNLLFEPVIFSCTEIETDTKIMPLSAVVCHSASRYPGMPQVNVSW